MMLTLSWKELREHRAIWVAMVVMTGVFTFALASLSDPFDAPSRVGLTALVMATAFGVVCGAMMFAGERENGTLVFLDTFSGRRGEVWSAKLLIGLVLASTEALAVAFTFVALTWLMVATQGRVSVNLNPPEWLIALLGQDARMRGPGGTVGMDVWFLVLPAITLESFAWGLMGSAMTSRVLSAAAMAAAMAAVLWIIGLCGGAAPVFLALRILAALIALFVSCTVFLNQNRDAGSTAAPASRADERARGMQRGQRLQRAAERWQGDKFDLERRAPWLAGSAALPPATSFLERDVRMREHEREPRMPQQSAAPVRRGPRPEQAYSPGQVLWWLTLSQAAVVLAIMASVAVLLGLFLPPHAELLWPLTTLLIGVGCGVAAFAPEQRDQSYQFLAAQHMPLKTVWNVKIGFWLMAATGVAMLMALGGYLTLVARRPDPARPEGFDFGILHQRMGPALFLAAWLLYGFAAGQFFVLFCQKNLLALLLAGLVGLAALSLWLPALLCGGTNGWQVWLPPIVTIVATRLLIRAWAGGRIKERKPVLAVLGLAGFILVWPAANAGVRTWEIPDVGAPLDRSAFREAVRVADANRVGQKIREALSDLDARGPALVRLTEASRLPVGMIQTPPDSGPPLDYRHLPACHKLSQRLSELAEAAQTRGESKLAFDHLDRILVLSRNLRNKAPVASYLAGIDIEEAALKDLQLWLENKKPSRESLAPVLKQLNRHADQTPPPLDCVQTECFRSGGLLDNANGWSFFGPGVPGQTPKRWLANGIMLSLDTPWEYERKTRLWAVVWAGLLRGIETPHWELPASPAKFSARKDATQEILKGWLPSNPEWGDPITVDQVACWLDDSWLSDTRLFTPIVLLRDKAARARWRMDSTRLAVALALHQITERKPARSLHDLVPKYLRALPVDPYSGADFSYRVSDGRDDRLDNDRLLLPGQGLIWRTRPERLVAIVPSWP